MKRMLLHILHLLILAVLLLGDSISSAAQQDAGDGASPMRPNPEGRALELPDTECAMRADIAILLHEAQEHEVRALRHNIDAAININSGWRRHFLTGLALALEEYYQMELSYPDCTEQLVESGYLLADWSRLGLHICDFDSKRIVSRDKELIYVPQPIGLVTLIEVPGRSCAHRMRCYLEYSFAVPDCFTSNWGTGDVGLCTDWMTPFCEFEITEILHVSQTRPEIPTCSTCKPSR